jgi:hypothetical protein
MLCIAYILLVILKKTTYSPILNSLNRLGRFQVWNCLDENLKELSASILNSLLKESLDCRDQTCNPWMFSNTVLPLNYCIHSIIDLFHPSSAEFLKLSMPDFFSSICHRVQKMCSLTETWTLDPGNTILQFTDWAISLKLWTVLNHDILNPIHAIIFGQLSGTLFIAAIMDV